MCRYEHIESHAKTTKFNNNNNNSKIGRKDSNNEQKYRTFSMSVFFTCGIHLATTRAVSTIS